MAKGLVYSEKQKADAVKLVLTGTPMNSVADLYKVKRSTIKKWHDELKDSFEIPKQEVALTEKTTTELAVKSDKLTEKATEVAYYALERLREQLTFEENTEKIAKALTAIHGFLKKDNGDKPGNSKGGWVNHIEKMIINNNRNNPEFLQSVEINEENN